jgi:hypothetical protein
LKMAGMLPFPSPYFSISKKISLTVLLNRFRSFLLHFATDGSQINENSVMQHLRLGNLRWRKPFEVKKEFVSHSRLLINLLHR